MLQEPVDRGGVKARRVILRRARQAVRTSGIAETQVKARAVARQRHPLDVQTVELKCDVGFGPREKHHVDQRRFAAVPVAADLGGEPLERQILMVERREQRIARVPQQLVESQTAVEVAANSQRVDEEADQRLEFGPASICNRRTDDQIGLAGRAIQHDVEDREQRGEQRRTMRPPERGKARGDLRPDAQRADRAAALRSGGARTVGGEIDPRRCTVERGTPEREIARGGEAG